MDVTNAIPKTAGRLAGPALLVLGLLVPALAARAERPFPHPNKEFTADFATASCTFTDVGRNRFLVLEPGHELLLAGETRDGWVEVRITVLDETKVVDGVVTRVVEEHETVDGVPLEITRNHYALCAETGDAYSFGEEVVITDDGGPAGSAGSWEAGVGGAQPGIAMPGTFLLGARHQMQVAPGVAMDRAENRAMGVTVDTPAGTFTGCVLVEETSPLEPDERTLKAYAEGIGPVMDAGLLLVEWTPAPPPGS
jgi:hypothetical protein